MNTLTELLEASAALHRHLCPRQVLGVRMSMYAGELLGLEIMLGRWPVPAIKLEPVTGEVR